MSRYDDIINLPHHEPKRPRMSPENRAAQFAPFAALTGHDDAIAETARITSEKLELSDAELESLSRRISYAMEKKAQVVITYFVPDIYKKGGKYQHVTGRIRKIDEAAAIVILTDRRNIPLADIYDIRAVSDICPDKSHSVS